MFVDDADLNQEVRDPLNFLLAPPRAFAYRSAALSLTNGAWTLIGLDAEIYDPYTPAAHDNATNNSRLVAAETGLYTVNLKVRFGADTTGTARRFELRKNAAGSQVGGTLVTTQAVTSTISFSTTINETLDVQLNAADYLELFANQNSGVTLGLVTGSDSTFLQMRWATKQ